MVYDKEMNMNKKTIITILLAIAAMAGQAQTKVQGHVVNERGETVEDVRIGIEEDGVGVISDAQGHFALTIPAGRRDDLTFTHVSYQTTTIPYATYTNGQQLTVTMKDKVVELAEVVVGKKNKPQKIAGKAISGPMASFRGKGKVDGTEWGPVFKSKKDYVISDILLTIKGTSYQWCVLSFNIYEIRGDRFVNILNKPIYQRIEKSDGKQRLDIRPEETIVLKGKKKYYISVMVVDSDRYGILDMQSQFKTSYYRVITKGKKRKLPIGPAIMVKGYEIEQQPK